MKSKEFNYDAAKNGAPVMTRDGRAARIICMDFKDEDTPIIAAVTTEGGDRESVYGYTEEGRYDTRMKHSYDLVMAPVVHTGWTLVNIGDNLDEAAAQRVGRGKRLATAVVFYTLEEAEKACKGREDVTIGELKWTD